MNTGAYGDGHGGTDGAQQIAGYGHGVQGGDAQHADWNAIRKANTPY